MNKLKMGTPAMGMALGCMMVGAGALVMLIGFWKTVILVALFAVGYFLGAVNNKTELVKETADRIVPRKEPKQIDLMSDIKREQEEEQAAYNSDEETAEDKE